MGIFLRYQNHNPFRYMDAHTGVYVKPGYGQPAPAQAYPGNGWRAGGGKVGAHRYAPPGPNALGAAMFGRHWRRRGAGMILQQGLQ